MRYLHTMVRVTDLDAALHFYGTLFGLTEVRRSRANRAFHARLSLAARDDLDQAKSASAPLLELTWNWDHEDYTGGAQFRPLAYEVDNIYETCQNLMMMPASRSTVRRATAIWPSSARRRASRSNCCRRASVWRRRSLGPPWPIPAAVKPHTKLNAHLAARLTGIKPDSSRRQGRTDRDRSCPRRQKAMEACPRDPPLPPHPSRLILGLLASACLLSGCMTSKDSADKAADALYEAAQEEAAAKDPPKGPQTAQAQTPLSSLPSPIHRQLRPACGARATAGDGGRHRYGSGNARTAQQSRWQRRGDAGHGGQCHGRQHFFPPPAGPERRAAQPVRGAGQPCPPIRRPQARSRPHLLNRRRQCRKTRSPRRGGRQAGRLADRPVREIRQAGRGEAAPRRWCRRPAPRRSRSRP